MLLNQDQLMIRDAVRAFAQEQLWPHAARWDKEHHFPEDAHRGLADLGAYGICVPEALGGAGLDYVTLAVVLEEIAAGDGGENLGGGGLDIRRIGTNGSAAGVAGTNAAGGTYPRRLEPWMQYNLQVGKNFGENTRATFTIVNVLNDQYREDNSFTGYPYFQAFIGADPLGRRFNLSVQHNF